MDPIMEILCQGLRVSIGIFTISNPRRYSKGGRTLGLITRAVWAEAEAGSFGDRRREKQERYE